MYILKFQPPNTKLRAWKFLNNGITAYREAKYEVGQIYKETDFSEDERILCDKGLNIATLQWCFNASQANSEFIEVEFFAKDIVAIPFTTDGKFRVKRFEVLRKINRGKAKNILNGFLKSYIKKDETEADSLS